MERIILLRVGSDDVNLVSFKLFIKGKESLGQLNAH
jgi:hypothetical protein